MTTKLLMQCDGCGAEAKTESIRMKFHSFNGKGYGFGQWHPPDIDKAVEPTGWMWCDPYTACTYCPTCWAEIEAGSTQAAE